jgi:ectoine hydroxylase-related dioxygenase (phytanoyl-CoA dioxygenase family)
VGSDRRFGSPPPSDLEVRPTEDDIAFFAENGFLVVDRITTDDELEWLTKIFLAIFDEDEGQVFEPGREPDQQGPTQLSQSLHPEIRFPELLETTYRRNALHFAAALLDVSEAELSSWGHMIRKPALKSRAAPWHQDEAYWRPELTYHALAVWLPLHEVTVDRGAMQFIPGSHKGDLLMHHHVGDPRGNLLEAEGADPAKAVPCPLPAGGATFHHHRTLHFTAPNTTPLDRLAYPMEFQLPPQRRPEPINRPWVDAFRDAVGGDLGPPLYVANGRVITL